MFCVVYNLVLDYLCCCVVCVVEDGGEDFEICVDLCDEIVWC